MSPRSNKPFSGDIRVPAVVGVVALGLVVLVTTAVMANIAEPSEISDPGLITRWGLPISRFVHHIAMVTAIAAALYAATIVPPQERSFSRKLAYGRQVDEHPLFKSALLISGFAAVIWTAAALVVLIFTFSLLAGQTLSASEEFSRGFFNYIVSVETGQAWMVVVLIAGGFTTAVIASRTPTLLLLTALGGLTAIVPIALVGHSASDENHMAAVNSFTLHFLGVTLWVGGLLVLGLLALVSSKLRREATDRTRAHRAWLDMCHIVRRYSVLAGVGLVLTAASGVINAMLRVIDLGDLVDSDYGLMLVVKLAATCVLAAIGWAHRRWTIPQIIKAEQHRREKSARSLWRLVYVEILIMTAIIAVSVVLGRTSPPGTEEEYIDASPALILTGYDLPPEPEWLTWIAQWRPDWLWIAAVLMSSGWYLCAVWKLRSQGARWPLFRLFSWLAGAITLVWVTSSGPAVYGQILFSAHLIQHMLLTFIVPLLLVTGAPLTLAEQSLPHRDDGTHGPLEWVRRITGSRTLHIARNPMVATALLSLSTLLFYFTPVFGFSLEYHLGHELMILLFLLVGCLFIQAIVYQPCTLAQPHGTRVLALVVATVVFAMLSTYFSLTTTLIQPEWFGALYPEWAISPIADQQLGGKLLGILPTLFLVVMTFRAAMSLRAHRAQVSQVRGTAVSEHRPR